MESKQSMKVAAGLGIVLVVGAFAWMLFKPHDQAKAGTRISIKHGLDPEAKLVDLNPKPISIAELIGMRMPEDAKGDLSDYADKRIGDFEKSTYRIEGTLKSVVLRKDGDYYMVVDDGAGHQAIVEVPDPKLCKGSPMESQITATRKQIEDKYHPTSETKEVNEPASVQGVGFMGFKGRQGSGARTATPRLMPGTGITFGK